MADQARGLRELMDEKRRRQGPLRVIAVASGKGGVGKTNVAANLAIVAARSGKRVLVIDGDLGLANIEILYNLKPKYHLGHLLHGGLSIEQVLAVGPQGVHVLPAGSGIQALTRLEDSQKLRLVSALDVIEDQFDLVLIDSSAGIGDNVVFFSGAAQESLLVVSPEPTSLTDAYAALKVLCQEAGVKHFGVVVNPSANDAGGRAIFEKLATVSGRFLDAHLRYLGFIPRDENLHRAVMAQRPMLELFPHSPASRALVTVANNLFDEAPPGVLEGGLKFLFGRLFREAEASQRVSR